MIHREISDKKYQMDSLDGLRGFAALIVVVGHCSNVGLYFVPLLDLRGTAKSGVFLFFLLSSFLLTLPLLKKGREVLSFKVMSHYWQRRFFRIYPLYTVYLLFAVVCTWYFLRTTGNTDLVVPFELDWRGFVKHMALLDGAGVTWSIAVEFKFYFVLPFLVLAISYVRSFGYKAVILFFIALMLLSQYVSPQGKSLISDTRLLPYMPVFIVGMFLAVLQDFVNRKGLRGNERFVAVVRVLGFVGVIGVLLMTPSVLSLFGERIPNWYFHKQFIQYALVWSLVLFSAVNVDGVIQKFFTLKWLRYYGALSFSLYLFHPIFMISLTNAGLSGYVAAWAVLALTTLTAYISFRVLEYPVSRFKLDSWWQQLNPRAAAGK